MKCVEKMLYNTPYILNINEIGSEERRNQIARVFAKKYHPKRSYLLINVREGEKLNILDVGNLTEDEVQDKTYTITITDDPSVLLAMTFEDETIPLIKSIDGLIDISAMFHKGVIYQQKEINFIECNNTVRTTPNSRFQCIELNDVLYLIEHGTSNITERIESMIPVRDLPVENFTPINTYL